MEFGYPTVQERLLRTRKSLFTLRRSDRPAKIGEPAMTLSDCLASGPVFMEGALGERLKREYGLAADGPVALAGLVYEERGRSALKELWKQYLDIAERYALPFLATTPTRRCNQERLALSPYNGAILGDNLRLLREALAQARVPVFAGGLLGCRGDAYSGQGCLSEAESREFHRWEAEGFRAAGADFLLAALMPTLPEALGMAAALSATGLPFIISFTLQKDGRLMDGTTLHDSIAAIDALPGQPPLCYMANCVHPRIVAAALDCPWNQTTAVKTRFLGIQANASDLSFAELDGAGELHGSPPAALAREMSALRERFGLRLFGGCCGTDARHMEAVARALRGLSC